MVSVKAAGCRRHDGKGAAFSMNTNRVTNEAIAYFAGLFDGEGSINIFKQPNKKDRINPCYFLEISMGNTHKGVLHWVLENFGGRLTHNAEQQTNRNHRTWRWRASSNEACAMLKILLPYLLVKKNKPNWPLSFKCMSTPIQEKETRYFQMKS
jgi:hypothetical protein